MKQYLKPEMQYIIPDMTDILTLSDGDGKDISSEIFGAGGIEEL